jgi:cleavage and polyadenylation specificity factor subunit 1
MSMLYGELTSPTAVSHVLKAQLVSLGEENLIVAKSSLLQIFRIETSVRETQIRHSQTGRNAAGDAMAEALLGEDGGEDFMGDDSQVQLLRHEKVGRLVLIDEIHLSGTVTGMVNMGMLQGVPTETDCVAISFQDAKVHAVHLAMLTPGVDIILGIRLPFAYNAVNPSLRTRVL